MPEVAVQETLSALFASFRERSAPVFVTSLNTAHARVPDGMNKGDVGSHFRLAAIIDLPGLLLADGPLTAEPVHASTPKNTTRIRIPHEGGDALALVYCVTRESDRVFKLTKREVPGLANFPAAALLLDTDTPLVPHLVIGISHRPRRKDGSRKFTVWLLGGTIDFQQRMLRADYVDEIVTFETPGGAGEVGSVQPAGPRPILSPKARRGEGGR